MRRIQKGENCALGKVSKICIQFGEDKGPNGARRTACACRLLEGDMGVMGLLSRANGRADMETVVLGDAAW